MPRFNNEHTLLEKLRDNAKNLMLWTEFVNGKLENARYEIINGSVILSPSPTLVQSEISNNLIYLFFRKFDDYFCLRYFDIKIDENNHYFSIISLTKKSDIQNDDTFTTKPVVIFEILTTQNKHLLNTKFEHYQQITSLQEYIVINLNTPQICLYRKENNWQAEQFTIEQTFKLNSIDYSIKVADIYWGIEW